MYTIPQICAGFISNCNLISTIMQCSRAVNFRLVFIVLWKSSFHFMRDASFRKKIIQLLHLGHVIPNPELPGFLRHVSHFCISFRQPPWPL